MSDFTIMMDSLCNHGPAQNMLKSCYTVLKTPARIALHFPSFFSTWGATCKASTTTSKRGDMLKVIRGESYYIKDNVLIRVSGKPMRTLILSLDPKDNPPAELLNWIVGGLFSSPKTHASIPNPKATKSSVGCICSSRNLFQFGCKCGGY